MKGKMEKDYVELLLRRSREAKESGLVHAKVDADTLIALLESYLEKEYT